MHPVLFKIGGFELRAYGLMLALSFLAGIWLATRRAKKKGVDPAKIMDVSVIIIISSIVGSRILYVIFHLDEFKGRWLDTINPIQSDGQIGIAGLTLLGGVLLSFISCIVYFYVKKLSFLKFADIIVPSVALGIFLTRIGCYLNGCCFGLPCDGALCVDFPHHSPAGSVFPNQGLIPTQLYSSFYGLFMLVALLYLERFQKIKGFLFYWFLILYGISRFVIDFFRFYESSMVLLKVANEPISVNQVISFLFILFGIAALLYTHYHKKRPAAQNS